MLLLTFFMLQLGGNLTNSTSANFTGNFTAFNITALNTSTFTGADVGAVPTITEALITNPAGSVLGLVGKYGYTAITVMTALEGLSFPIPSEVVLPAAGIMSKRGYMNFGTIYLLILAANLFGLIVDYYIGYYLGRKFFYRHLKLFKLDERMVSGFEDSFSRNAPFAVFITRLLPVVRTLASYTAGFIKMPMLGFLYFSMSGIMIWSFVLMMFGYYLISSGSASLIISALAILAVLLYFGKKMVRKMTEGGSNREKK